MFFFFFFFQAAQKQRQTDNNLVSNLEVKVRDLETTNDQQTRELEVREG